MKLPQLHLRDLFWLVLVAALGCAWGLDHRRLTSEIEKLLPIQIELHDMGAVNVPRINLNVQPK
jgi:hypothetical protein